MVDEVRFRELISGKRRGFVAVLLRIFLRLLSWGYRFAIFARNKAYDFDLKKSQRANAKVISVGNLTTGGTGKTPLVAFLSDDLKQRNIAHAILSRGYRSLDDDSNDEKLMLDKFCPGVPHLQNPNRVSSAQTAVEEHGAKVLILDDGFQHRRLQRDLDIVLIDAINPWGYGTVLPRGLLREPISALQRADLVVVTRADFCDKKQLEQIELQIGAVSNEIPIVKIGFPPRSLVNAAGEKKELSEFAGSKILACCGIGHPEGFRKTLSLANLKPVSFEVYPDHHRYTEDDWKHLQTIANQKEASVLLTTMKDLVKLEQFETESLPIWAVEIGVEFLAGEETLKKLLAKIP